MSTETPTINPLHSAFRADMEAAKLFVTDVKLSTLGHDYEGPAVQVRDFNVARAATKLNLLTAPGKAPGSIFVIPIDEPLTL